MNPTSPEGSSHSTDNDGNDDDGHNDDEYNTNTTITTLCDTVDTGNATVQSSDSDLNSFSTTHTARLMMEGTPNSTVDPSSWLQDPNKGSNLQLTKPSRLPDSEENGNPNQGAIAAVEEPTQQPHVMPQLHNDAPPPARREPTLISAEPVLESTLNDSEHEVENAQLMEQVSELEKQLRLVMSRQAIVEGVPLLDGDVVSHPAEEEESNMDEDSQPYAKHIKWRYFIILLLLFGAIICVSVVYTSARTSENSDRTDAPSLTPTSSPTAFTRRGYFVRTIFPSMDEYAVYNTAEEWDAHLLGNPDTPQAQAVQWLSEVDNYTDSRWIEEQELLERYALVVLYFSTSGPKWDASGSFLDPLTSVCSWTTNGYLSIIFCTEGASSLYVSRFRLTGNFVIGTLPSEVTLFQNIKSIIMFGTKLFGTLPPRLPASLETLQVNSNSISGSLPSEWVRSSPNLVELSFSHCNLVGSIPSEYGHFTKLEALILNSNSLTGTIPTTLGLLTTLDNFQVANNQLTGSLPSELGYCTAMSMFLVEGNDFTGSVPAEYYENWGDSTRIQI